MSVTNISHNTPRSSSHPEAHQRAAVDIYQTVTNQIIEAIEQGIKKDGKPLWHGQGSAQSTPYNFKTGKRYRGINVLSLWIAANLKGYGSAAWLTFRQALELGGQVRKGEKATTVIYYQETDRKSTDTETGEVEIRHRIILKSYALFNLDQVEGIETNISAEISAIQCIEIADQILLNSKATIIEEGIKAFYRPSSDEIYLPSRNRFTSTEIFYSVAMHELMHWTGHPSRLDRNFTGRFGDESYAFEELIAEIGSAFVCAELGISSATIDNHASYIDGWLNVLSRDKKAIFTAASQAAKAYDYLMGS